MYVCVYIYIIHFTMMNTCSLTPRVSSDDERVLLQWHWCEHELSALSQNPPPPAPLSPWWRIIEHVAVHIPHCLFELFHWLQTVRNSNKLKPHTFIWRFGSINRGAAASANQTQSEQRDLQHRDPDMTPTIISKEHLPLNNKVHSPPTYSSITAAALTAFLNHWLIWSTRS